ncbi:hypothetical protein IE53DRAFT_58808 [Violaceomyces palustris]|uniref:Uncharacterized protein n=1 Tax=Violaceomyces palustris TaxID=1673888 RepID=A0ACD0NZW6_9BASI|nr:hypothetical protein IE53DRAFT_58808 [Violaceomyces palustris]
MDQSELQVYEHQLSQVESALSSDPSNAELKNLRDELVNLITLTKSLVETQPAAPEVKPSAASSRPKASSSSSPPPPAQLSPTHDSNNPASAAIPAQYATKPAHRFAAGEDCQARYAADGRWYPARITSVGGSAQNPVYSIVFKGYNTTELLTAADLRPNRVSASSATSSSAAAAAAITSSTTSTGRKRAAEEANVSGSDSKIGSASGSVAKKKQSEEEEAEKERKRRKNEKKSEKYAAKQAAQEDKAQAWQKFAKKGAKKGYGMGGEKSIFKTPDDPYAKVGVVGAGRGMTQYNQRSKHVYEEN